MGGMGYYCTDTATPIVASLMDELRWDAAIVKMAVECLVNDCNDRKSVYALTTHPGHHAGCDEFGGYCYINHAAFAAKSLQNLLGGAPVAVLDIGKIAKSVIFILFSNFHMVLPHINWTYFLENKFLKRLPLWKRNSIHLLQRSISFCGFDPLRSRLGISIQFWLC